MKSNWIVIKMYLRAFFWIDPMWEEEWYFAQMDKIRALQKEKKRG